MSAKGKQTITKTSTTTRQKKKPEGSLTCPICGGAGHVPKGYNKKKS